MNVEDDFVPRDSRTETEESPEDFLFAVPEDSASPATSNPYDTSANTFEDEAFPDHSMGPCSFGMDEPADVAPSNPSSELANLFLDDDELSGDERDDVPHGGMPGLITHSYDMPAGAPVEPPSFGDGPSVSPSEPTEYDSQTIPGRSNRVSYSQTQRPPSKPKVTGVGRKEFRPVVDRPNAMSKSHTSSAWMVPFAAFLSGSCFSAYYFVQIGSPVLAGVTSTLGVIAALFCRVLFRR